MLNALFNAPVTFGVDLFVWILCILLGFGAGLTLIDALSTAKKDPEDPENLS